MKSVKISLLNGKYYIFRANENFDIRLYIEDQKVSIFALYKHNTDIKKLFVTNMQNVVKLKYYK